MDFLGNPICFTSQAMAANTVPGFETTDTLSPKSLRTISLKHVLPKLYSKRH